MPLIIVLILWIGLEAWLISRLAERIGGGDVLLLLLAAAVGGLALIRRQGLRTVRELRLAAQRGELPGPVLLEGLVVIMAGVLLLLPGLVSDALALSVLLLGARRSLAQRLGEGIARARPDLKKPVTLEGEYKRTR